MNIQSVMTANPAFCIASTPLHEVAQLMALHDCGEIPVVDENQAPIGVITDRDIVIRTVAHGMDPKRHVVGGYMTSPCISITPDQNLDACCELMEALQVRRIPVVDREGKLCGIVSLADVAEHAERLVAVEVLKEVSEPTMVLTN